MSDQASSRTMTCIQCPRSCRLTVGLTGGVVTSVEGNGCQLGPIWAKREVEDPVRTLTTSVRVMGGREELVSVRTQAAIPRRLLADALAAAKGLNLWAPVESGTIVVPDLAGTGVALVATRTVVSI